MKTRLHLVISGRVQGVCFRMYAQEEAESVGVTGWIRNCPDGSVEVVVEGEEQEIGEFLAWCRHGPPHARVMGVREESLPATGEFASFDITR